MVKWTAFSCFLLVVLTVGLERAASEPSTRPLRQTELLALVAGNALPENVVRELGANGLAFHPDDAYRTLMKNAGADETILKTLDSAKVVVAEGSEDRADSALLQHLSDAGKLLKLKKDADAATELSAALSMGIRSPESGFVMGEVLRQEERWADALAIYHEVLQEDPNFPEVHTKLSYILYHTGDYDEGLREARAALVLTPENAEAHKNAGLALEMQHRYDAGIAEYQESLRIKPDYEATRVNLGNLLREEGRLDDAIVEYKKALVLKPDDDGAHNNLGYTLTMNGDLNGAIYEYREALKLNPGEFEAHVNLASALADGGMYAEAVTVYRETVKMFPDSAEVCRQCMGSALLKIHDFDGAEKEYRTAMKMDPSDFGPHIGLGTLYETLNNYPEALREYRQAVAMNAGSPDAHFGEARVLLYEKDYVHACDEFNEAENLRPGDPLMDDMYGQALEGSGKVDEAIAEFSESLSFDPKQVQVMIRLAEAMEKKGDWPNAIDEYHRAALADASVDLRGKIMRSDDRDPQREYEDARKRFSDYLTALKANGKTVEATSLEGSVRSINAAPALSEQVDAAIQAGLNAARQQHFDEAQTNFKQAVELADKLQPHDARLVSALDYLGVSYVREDPAAAQATFERELKVAGEIYGPDSPNTVAPLQSLGNNALMQKDYASAEKFYFRAVDIDEKFFGESNDSVAKSLIIATNPYIVSGDYEKAEPYLLRAEHIDESLYGMDSINLSMPLASLCGLYDRWQKPDKSAACDQHLLTILEKQYGPDSPVLVSTLSNEAKALRGLGKATEADQVDNRVASIRAATMKTN